MKSKKKKRKMEGIHISDEMNFLIFLNMPHTKRRYYVKNLKEFFENNWSGITMFDNDLFSQSIIINTSFYSFSFIALSTLSSIKNNKISINTKSILTFSVNYQGIKESMSFDLGNTESTVKIGKRMTQINLDIEDVKEKSIEIPETIHDKMIDQFFTSLQVAMREKFPKELSDRITAIYYMTMWKMN